MIEIKPFREIGPKPYSVHNLSVRRGLADFAPKRLETAKLVATLVNQTCYDGKVPKEISVFASEPDDQVAQSLGFCQNIAPTSIFPFSYDLFWEALDRDIGPHVFAILGHGGLGTQLRRKESEVNLPAVAPEVVERLEEVFDGDDRVQTVAPFVVEEVPGKLRVLEIEAKTRASLRRVRKSELKLEGQEYQRVLAARKVKEGWGFAGFHWGQEKGTRNIYYGRYSVPQMERLGGMEFAVEIAAQILKSRLGVELRDLSSLRLAVPQFSFLTDLIQSLHGRMSAAELRATLRVDDCFLGWHPVLSAVDLLGGAESSPNLMIHSNGMPHVDIAVTWSNDGQ